MNTAELITTLNKEGIRLWADGNRLRLHAPKGALTAELKESLSKHKTELLESLKVSSSQSLNCSTACGLKLSTIGQLIGGGKDSLPTIDPQVMAKQLQVTFRPLPKRHPTHRDVLSLRAALEASLRSKGVTIVPWEEATRSFHRPGRGFLAWRTGALSVVRSNIAAVIDVERPASLCGKVKVQIAETLYKLSALVNKTTASVAEVAQHIAWAEDHAMQRLEDPTATQVVLLTPLDSTFADPEISYTEKIGKGVNTLVSQFSEIVIGADSQRLSILNMNLSDALFSRQQLDRFVVRSLIPKLYVPISPIPLSRFEISRYRPVESSAAKNLVQLSRALATTGLFPAGFKLAEVVHRRSHRDIVSAIVNGRTGVSYGFVAYVEKPQYIGPVEISESEWQALAPVEGPAEGPVESLSAEDVRQTDSGRRYLQTSVDGQIAYRQVPDIWLVCSRSGANKTDLAISQDVLRIGMTGSLQLQVPEEVLPEGTDIANSKIDIKPSYDTYVMVAIALSAALYAPALVENGAPMIHFHGYPEKAWFTAGEDYAGTENPAVPCGTYESGVFNFLSIHQLASSGQQPLKLVGLIEPDHGINLLASDLDYLLERVRCGVKQSQIELGGRYLPTLTEVGEETGEATSQKPSELAAVGGGIS